MSANPPLSAAPGDLALDGGPSLAELLDVVRRRRLPMILVGLLVLALAAAVALSLPPVYRSTAKILIKEQEIPPDLVRSTVTSDADERIQVISQQVMTRNTLLEMVERNGLYAKARQRETNEEILDRMRRDIKLTPIIADATERRGGGAARSIIGFTLAFDNDQAASAQKVTNELTTLFLNENVKNRQQKAAETTTFLDEELARVSEHISEVERRVAEFKRRNQGRLPEFSQANQVASERTFAEIQRLDREIAFAEDRLRSFKSQIEDTKPQAPLVGSTGPIAEPQERLLALQTQLTSLQGSFSDAHPDVRRLRREIASLKAELGEAASTVTESDATRRGRLAELGEQLQGLRQKYAEDHPDVVRLRRSIAALEAAPAPTAGAASAAGTAASTSATAKVRKPDNPTYLALRSQIEAGAAQLQSLRAERESLREKLQQIDARLGQTPEVEREFLEQARDLDTSRARFRELRDKQAQAQVAEQLERGRKAERFTLLEPALFPEKPYRPNRPAIFGMGAVFALVAAAIAALLAEAVDRTVHSPREAMRILQVPVLAVIPPMAVASAGGTRRWRWLLGGAVLLLALGLSAVQLFYLPLDVFGFALLRRLGL